MTALLEVPVDGGPYAVTAGPDGAMWVTLVHAGAVARVTSSPLEKLIITDSIQATEAVRVAQNIHQLTVAPLIGEAMERISSESSVSSLFD